MGNKKQVSFGRNTCIGGLPLRGFFFGSLAEIISRFRGLFDRDTEASQAENEASNEGWLNLFYSMAGKDLTKMDYVMNMPLVEFLNYAAMLKDIRQQQDQRISAAAKSDIRVYIATLIREMI